MQPAIILVRPQMGENIGATARAMANFGVGELRLVAPRDGWPNPKAGDVAGKAMPILDDATIYETTQASVADRQFVLAMTARPRHLPIRAMELREAIGELRTRAAQGKRCAIMFGPERTGLENEDIVVADAAVSIPVAPGYASLNVGQAVVVALYEWFASAPREAIAEGDPVADRAELQGLFDHLERALDGTDFWRVPEKKESMWRNIRVGLMRARFSAHEVATWRGIVRALSGA